MPKVLIVTHSDDDHVPLVEAELLRIGVHYYRFDTGVYEALAQFNLENGRARTVFPCGRRSLPLDDFSAVLFRHVRRAELSHLADDPELQRFIRHQVRAAQEGAILALQPKLWVNHPFANQQTRNKVLQLRVAAQLGFTVPDTVVTADPNLIRAAFENWQGAMVTKLAGGQIVGQSVEDQYVIHTTRVAAADLEDEAALGAAPAIYQRLADKAFDVRVTVIGDKIFACRIHSQETAAGHTDWRAAGHQNIKHAACEIPAALASRCLALLRHYGLHMAGIDFVEKPDGSFTFLEINAAGQWAWIERATGQPIAAEIACQLASAR